MIRGTDGLDYKDLTEKLLGNPADTARNRYLQVFGPKDPAYRAVLALPAEASSYDIYDAGRRTRYAEWVTANQFAVRSNIDSIRSKIGLSGQRPYAAIIDDLDRLNHSVDTPAPAHPAGPGPEGAR